MSANINTAHAIQAETAGYLNATKDFYQFFARLFHHEMDAEFWSLFKAAAPSLPAFAGRKSAQPKLLEVIARYDGLPASETLSELANLYAKAFLGMQEWHSISLVQSVYTSPGHLMGQQSFFDALAAYRSEELDLAEEEDLPADHLAVILAFMARQTSGAAALASKGQGGQALAGLATLRDKLLLGWIGALAERAKQLMPDSLYTVCLQYLEEFLEYDRQESALCLADYPGK